MENKIQFKSYCWSVGTTSYRTDKFNLNIEWQLALLKNFRKIKTDWSRKTQQEYYNFLKENGFVKGNATRPAKDARQKTSGLVDIGLLDKDRNLTEVGEKLLVISQTKSFEQNNLLEIPQDSYIFFKQMLKTYNNINGNIVRPFIVFLYVINKTEYLTNEEFTYLLPLCINQKITEQFIQQVALLREGKITSDNIITSIFINMDNYKHALKLFLEKNVTEELFSIISMNRKSSKNENVYCRIYEQLKDIVLQNIDRKKEFLDAVGKISNGKTKTFWRKYFFKKIRKNILEFKDIPILQVKNEQNFKIEFFKLLHLFKIKATLSDYFDLNRRYFKSTDTVLFEDNRVKLDVLPKCYINIIGDKLKSIAFSETDLLDKDVELSEISPYLNVDRMSLYNRLGKIIGKNINNRDLACEIIKKDKYERFNRLIEEKFDKETLIQLLNSFENREDKEIHQLVTDNADIPTIFEYVLAIAWYVISDKKGDVLEYMNLSLDADLLPKTHASGGEADIVWKYQATKDYPAHTLLIEATLSDKTNQRRMEMEPVSRHLGDYILTHEKENSYCIFISNFLNPNVISDFRGRKQLKYYSANGEQYIDGMKIIPLETERIKRFLAADVRYKLLYQLFDKLFNDEEEGYSWYKDSIIKETNKIIYKI